MTKIQNGLENRLMNRLANFIEKRQFSHENDYITWYLIACNNTFKAR